MRTAAEFDQLYAVPDPWRISSASFRSRSYERCLRPYITGKKVLELGCGEGHLTQEAFNAARSVVGVDLSRVAIQRAQQRDIPNTRFVVGDLLTTTLKGYEVITAIECLYYLEAADRDIFLDKLRREHGGTFILSVPIVGTLEGRRYFTHNEIKVLLQKHDIDLIDFHNMMPRWDSKPKHAAAIAIKTIPGGIFLMNHLPESFVYQRCYIARC